MQIHSCVICKQDSLGGGSKVLGGMFFKLCSECLADEDALRLINEGLMNTEEDDDGEKESI